jgi:hypothetical protein
MATTGNLNARYSYSIKMVVFTVTVSAIILLSSTVAAFVRSSFDNVPALLHQFFVPVQFQIERQPAIQHIVSNVSMCYDDSVSASLIASKSNKSELQDSVKSNATNNLLYSLHGFDPTTTISNVEEASNLQDVCRVYIAPSTIPGAGYGLFAGISFRKGDLVTPGDGVVPIHNPVFHNGNVEHEDTFLWDEYVWSAATFSAMDIPGQGMEAASFGIGALPNCYFALLNVEDSESHGRDNANLESINSPGIGAFTPWYDRKSYATKNIHVGSELYVDYGYAYFTSRVETIGYVPFLDDYKIADRMLKRFSNITDNFGYKSDSHVAPTTQLSEDLFQLSRTILDTWPNRIFRALPKNSTMITNVLQHGGTIQQDYLRSIRNIDYLQTYGACMDHLYVESSKLLPHAGRGVFTSRPFKSGSIVASVPLIHIPDRKALTMYGESMYNHGLQSDEPIRNETDPIHQQLLLNYCFGHKQSSLLLCPYGIVSSLINHGTNALENIEHNEYKANLRIQWSTKVTKNPEWWNMSISTWAYLYRAGLAFEYVALRDIDAHEEILIDYGIEWQLAWEKHAGNWKPVQRLVDTLNERIDSVIPTSKEWVWDVGDININPQAVNLWCYDIYRTLQGLPATDEEAYPCRVSFRLYNRRTSSYVYTAEIFERRQNDDDTTCEEIFDEVLWVLPRDAFVYGGFNEVYDTNQYLMPTTFRHEIGIPESLMPRAWKNLDS